MPYLIELKLYQIRKSSSESLSRYSSNTSRGGDTEIYDITVSLIIKQDQQLRRRGKF
jgi:hypothetical protein